MRYTRTKALLGLMALLSLTGCLSRDDADKRLAKGCQAAATLFLNEGFKVKEIKKSEFKPSAQFGSGYRDVILTAIESDSWIDFDKEYKCTFADELDLMGTHRAMIYQVTVNEQTYGHAGSEILGDADTIIRLNDAVENAMAE